MTDSGESPVPQRWQRYDCTDSEQREAALTAAREAIDEGLCVVIPTDTVYGIAADGFSAAAVQRLLNAKRRGRDMPPPVLVSDPAVMMALGTDIPDPAKALAERFWPGALTLILTAQPSVRLDLGETRGTVAIRVPDQALARELLRRTGPLAVSSANVSGQPAATGVESAIDQLGESVAVYLDDGPTPGEVPSTIVDFTRSHYGEVVRRGRIGIDELRQVSPFVADLPETEAEPPDA